MISLFRTAFCLFALSATSIAAHAEEPQQTTAVYDDWLLQCSLTPAPQSDAKTQAPPAKPGALPAFPLPLGGRSCEVVQTYVVRETGGTLAKLAIGKLAGKDEIKGVLVTPLGVYLADGTSLKLDGTKEIKGAFTHCDKASCIAEFALSPQLITDMRAAKTIALGFTTGQRAALNLNVSTKGFASAYDAAMAQSR
jgi:invasion protein IalB